MAKKKNNKKIEQSRVKARKDKLRNSFYDFDDKRSDPMLGDYYDFYRQFPSSTSQSQIKLTEEYRDDKDSIEDSVELDVENNIDDHDPLWVLEPSDLDELSLSDINTIWLSCEKLCGTFEVAAEVYALLNVANGIDASYRGWQFYIDHPELKDLKCKLSSLASLDQINVEAVKPEKPKPSLNISSVLDHVIKGELGNSPSDDLIEVDFSNLSRDEVQNLWGNRFTSFNKISEACKALSLVRFYSDIDIPQRNWFLFKDSDLIQPLYYYLEDDTTPTEVKLNVSEDSMFFDKRIEKTQQVKVRSFQGNFREKVIGHYKFCCISGCNDLAALEAAHIMPYMGEHTNLLDNGLLLRVDLHRLFDKFLIAIEPNSLKIKVSPQISYTYYRSLHNKKLKINANALRKNYLERYYESYMKIHSK